MNREKIQATEGYFDLVRLDKFNRELERLVLREPALHSLVVEEVRNTLDSKTLKIVPGMGGWSKVRVPSPAMRKGKRGAFRAMFLFLKSGGRVYLATVYLKSEKQDLTPLEKSALALYAAEVKKV